MDNFKTFFTQDFTYWKAWGNTLIFALIKMPIEITFAMLLALALNKKMKGSGLFQAIYFLPNIISVAIVGLILSNMAIKNRRDFEIQLIAIERKKQQEREKEGKDSAPGAEDAQLE